MQRCSIAICPKTCSRNLPRKVYYQVAEPSHLKCYVKQLRTKYCVCNFSKATALHTYMTVLLCKKIFQFSLKVWMNEIRLNQINMDQTYQSNLPSLAIFSALVIARRSHRRGCRRCGRLVYHGFSWPSRSWHCSQSDRDAMYVMHARCSIFQN